MLLGTHHSLEDNIIVLLGKKSNQTVESLQQRLTKNDQTVTVQGIYRVLRKLQAEGIVIKEKKHYSLRIAWLLNLGNFIEETEDSYLQAVYMDNLLPQNIGEKRNWSFTNLLKLNDFWSQLLIAMVKTAKRKIAIHYCPHTWFDILERDQEKQFVKAFFELVDQDYLLIGGRTPLDQIACEQYQSIVKEHCYLARPEEYTDARRTLYLSIIGEYIMTIKINEQVAQKIDQFYTETPMELARNNERMYTLLVNLIKQKNNVKISIKRDPVLAQKYYKKFEKIFGPLEPNSRGNITTHSVPEHLRHTS